MHWEHMALNLYLTPGLGLDTHFSGEVPPTLHYYTLSPIFMVALPHALMEPLPLCVGPFPHASSTRPGHLAKAVTSLGGQFSLTTPIPPPHLLPECLTNHLTSVSGSGMKS